MAVSLIRSTASPAPVTVYNQIPSRRFWLSMGLNFHPDYGADPNANPYSGDAHQFYREGYGYAQAQLTGTPNPQPGYKDLVLNLGIKRLRCGAKPTDFSGGSFGVFQGIELSDLAFAADGERLKLCLIMGRGQIAGEVASCMANVNLNYVRATLGDSNSAYVPRLSYLEGPNEVDIFGGLTDMATAMQTIYNARASYGLTAIPIASGTVVNRNNYDTVGNIAAYIDGRAGHPYPGGWDVAHQTYEVMGRTNIFARGKGFYIATEGGYHTAYNYNGGLQWGVPEDVHQHYVPLTYLELFCQGASEVHQYELLDQYPGDPTLTTSDTESFYGLVRFDPDPVTGRPRLTPKPAFYAVQRLVNQVKDYNTTYTPSDYGLVRLNNTAPGRVSDASANDIRMSPIFARSDGKKFVYMYRRAPLWDHDLKTRIAPSSLTQTVVFPSTPSQVRTNLVSVDNTYTNLTPASTMTFTVDQRPLAIEITP